MPSLDEGEVALTTSQALVYPNVNSCLTITCMCRGQTLAGGHAAFIPPQGKKDVTKIMQSIKGYTKPGDRTYLLLIGATAFWEQNISVCSNGAYADLDALAADLNIPQGRVIKLNVAPWIGAANVTITVQTNGYVDIAGTNNGTRCYSFLVGSGT